MSKVQRSQLQRYGLSTLSVLLALLLGWLLAPLVNRQVEPLFLAAVVFSSGCGGLAAGLISTVLSMMVNDYFFTLPTYSLIASSHADVIQLILFGSVALLISFLTAALQTAKQRYGVALSTLQISYHRLLETANEGIWILNNEGKTEYVNQQLAEILGYSSEELANHSIFNFLEYQECLQIEQWLQQQRQSIRDIKCQFDCQLRHKEASPLWVILSISPILDQQGEFAGAIALITDVTQRKQAEQILALEQASHELERQRLRAILEILPVGVFISDNKGQLLEINSAARSIWGENAPLANEVTGYQQYKGWWASTGKLVAAEEWSLARTLATGEAFIGDEIDIETFNGERKTILSSAVPICDRTGAIINAVVVNVDITERKQAEAALRQSEAIAKARAEELETIMETVPAAVWIASDPHCHQMTANRTAYEMMRMPPGSIMTATPETGEYPFPFKIQKNGQDIPLDDLAMQQATRTGQAVETEFEFVFSKTDVRSIYGKAVPLRDDSGAIRGSIGAFLDVTERKQVEAALQQSNERLTLALDAARMGSWDWDLQTNQIVWTPYHEMIFGYEPGNPQRTYQEWADRIHPDDLPVVEAKIRTAMVEKRDYEDEYRAIWADGTLHWVSSFGRFQYNADGQPIRMLGMLLDINDRKQAELDLKNSEARFRRIFDSNIIGIFFGDLSGNITQANDAFLQMIGYTRQDLLAGEVNWQRMTPPEDAERTRQAVETLRNDGVCTPMEKAFFRKDGSCVFVVLAAALFEGSQEQGLCYVLDITARKQAEAERDRLLQLEQAARAEAEAANRTKDDFLAIVSHELRSPLNPILGWSNLLLSRKLDAAKTVQALEIIGRNAKLQARLIEDLLDVSRMLRGKLSLNISPVALVTTAEAALETVQLAAEAKSIDLKFWAGGKLGNTADRENSSPHSSPLTVLGDPNRLQQLIGNLLTNAVKFTPAGGRIELCLEKVGTFAQIQVTDTGKGISPDFLPHVFERFRQADEATTRKFGGLGLGLAIVRHIVELHGGSIQVASPGEGLGATFTVMLPLMNAVSSTREEVPLPEGLENLQGLRVMVVDDNVDTLNLLAFILEQYGVQVEKFTSAIAAFQAIATVQPDLLLSDIAMPEVDGYMLIQQIRALERSQGKHLPAIALTAFAGETDHQKIISAGFQKHLTKPVEPAELAATIADLSRQSSHS